MLWRISRTYATERVTADDLHQEILAAIWTGFSTFRGKAALSTWLYRVAINTCINFLRRHALRQLVPQNEMRHEIADAPIEHLKDEYECLTYLIDRLGPLDKAVLLMWLDELSYGEIADVTGLTPNNVGTRLTRIRTRLQKLWQKEINV